MESPLDLIHKPEPVMNHPALLSAMGAMLGRCDGAATRDDVGFNGLDARPARDLYGWAQSKNWSKKQHTFALKLLSRYPRQMQELGIELPTQGIVEAWVEARDENLAEARASAGNPYNASGETPNADGVIWLGEFRGKPSVYLTFPYNPQRNDQALRISAAPDERRCDRAFWDDDAKAWAITGGKGWDVEEVLREAVSTFPTFDVWGPARETWQRLEQERLARMEEARREKAARQDLINRLLVRARAIYDQLCETPGWIRYEHQEEGITFLIERLRAILADDMGLGKTLQAAIVAKVLQEELGAAVFVQAPVSMQADWKTMMALVGCQADIGTHDFRAIRKPLKNRPYYLIVDEAHKFQNRAAKRTRALFELANHHNCKGLALLTGTPMNNGDPDNIWPLIELCHHPMALDPEGLLKKRRTTPYAVFARRYKSDGVAHLKELHERITIEYPIMLRRTKALLKGLPGKERIQLNVEMSAAAREEWDLRFSQLQAEYWERVKEGTASEMGYILVLINHLRQAASKAKLEGTADLAEELIIGQFAEEREQLVIFAEFKHSARHLRDELRSRGFDVEILDGDTSPAERKRLVDDFQAGRLQILILLSGAGGVGLTLTAARYCILHDRPWNATNQLEDRIYRIGQKRDITWYWPSATRLDRKMDAILLRKAEAIGHVVAGEAQTIDGITNFEDAAWQVLQEIM